MPPKKRMCDYDTCKERVVTIIGHCSYCRKEFCTAHRLPETHACTAIELCKQIAFARNTSNLINGKCIASKVLRFV
jgi:predicted nucleic acid binding AN1-type Zn finger protein